VDQSTQDVATTQLRKGRRTCWVTTHRRDGRAQAEAAVRAVLVVVLDVGAQDVNKVLAASIFLDVLNIFQFILTLFGRRRR